MVFFSVTDFFCTSGVSVGCSGKWHLERIFATVYATPQSMVDILYTCWEILNKKLGYVVNFRTQISSSQSEERTMFFHWWEKWYVQSEATEVCEPHAKIPAFYFSLQHRFAERDKQNET